MELKRNVYEEDRFKDAPNAVHFNQNFYAIFRVGRKYMTLNSITGFEKHMKREIDVPNADTKIENEILIGPQDIKSYVEFYISDCKLRKNNIVARELLLTATHGFFNMPNLDKWTQLNVEWLKKEFGENCVYAVLHKDENTYHIHALIVPKFENSKGQDILSNKRYFDGKVALSNWQTKYAENMQTTFKQLNRGLKYSKAKHVEIRHFYSLINQKVDENKIDSLLANSIDKDLLEIKLKSLNKTLETYKSYWKKSTEEKELFKIDNTFLAEQLKDLQKDKQLYKESVELLAKIHDISADSVKEVMNFIEKELDVNINKKDVVKEREKR